ncbi:unnamed protein product [Prunus brigantina]
MVETRAQAKLKNKATEMTSEAPESMSPATITETEPTVRSSACEPIITERAAESVQEQAVVENLMDKQAYRIETSFMAAMDRFSSELRTLFQERMPISASMTPPGAGRRSQESERFEPYGEGNRRKLGTNRPDHNDRNPHPSGPATKAAERWATKPAADRGPGRSPCQRTSIRG